MSTGPPAHELTPRVRAVLTRITKPDEMTQVRAALALSLAMKLDESVMSDSAAAATACPQLSKELRAVLEEIEGAEDREQALIDSVFSQPQQ